MRFNVDRICELAGLEAASGGLLSEAAQPATVGARPAAPAAKPAAPAAKPAAAEMDADMEMAEEYEGHYMDETMLDDEAVYEIDETELMEALVSLRQDRIDESRIRDAVREEIARALTDRSGSWIYGTNKPTASHLGQISRGGFGIGFGFKK